MIRYKTGNAAIKARINLPPPVYCRRGRSLTSVSRIAWSHLSPTCKHASFYRVYLLLYLPPFLRRQIANAHRISSSENWAPTAKRRHRLIHQRRWIRKPPRTVHCGDCGQAGAVNDGAKQTKTNTTFTKRGRWKRSEASFCANFNETHRLLPFSFPPLVIS